MALFFPYILLCGWPYARRDGPGRSEAGRKGKLQNSGLIVFEEKSTSFELMRDPVTGYTEMRALLCRVAKAEAA